MANVFLNIPVPAANGIGAAVDVSAMGKTKSLVIGGGFRACVNVEYAIGDAPTDWAPLATFLQAGNLTIDVACQWIRAVTSEYVSGAPNLDVGADDAGIVFATLTADAASVDISALPKFKTVVVPNGFTGAVEASEDGASWAQIFSFASPQPTGQSREFVAQFARVIGGADVHIAGSDNGGGGGGGSAITYTFQFDTNVPVTVQDQLLLSTVPLTVPIGRKLIIQATLSAEYSFSDGQQWSRIIQRILRDPGTKGQFTLAQDQTYFATIPVLNLLQTNIAGQAEFIGDGVPHVFGIDMDMSDPPDPGNTTHTALRVTMLIIEMDV